MRLDYKTTFEYRCPSKLRRYFHHVLLGMIVLSLLLGFTLRQAYKKQPGSTYSLALPTLTTISNTPNTKELSSAEKPTSDKTNTALAKNGISESLHLVKIQRGDTLEKIFMRNGISKKDLPAILAVKSVKQHFTSLQPGQTLRLTVSPTKTIEAITLELSKVNTIKVLRTKNGFDIEEQQLPIENQLAFGKGTIRDSLFSSAKRAGLDNKVVSQLVDIFACNIDFGQHLKPNDTFRVLFEEKYLDGEKVESGNILAAEINNNGKKHLAIRYTDPTGNTAYFSPEGYSLQQAYLRTPVNFTRISSQFGLRRHPILHKLRQHKGVDYSAPRGTPVLAVGDAKVTFVGTRGGYGKAIELQHSARHSTFYAHLSRFAKNLRAGTTVKQGEVIGYVGRTGLATGDHLHFEFRIDGVHHNYLTASLPRKNSIANTNKQHFLAHAKEMIRLMDIHENKIQMAHRD